MATLNKTWTEIYNSYSIPVLPLLRTDGANQPTSFLYFFKEGLKANPSPWTVLASSNRTVADTNDNWSSPTDIIYGGSSPRDTWPGSWIILRSSTTPVLYMVLDYTLSATYRVIMRISEHQPDLSNLSPYRVPPPTGPEIWQEWAITNPGSGAYEYYITMVKADDGSLIYIGTMVGTNDNNVFMLNFVRDAAPQDPHPYIAWIKNSYTTNDVFLQPNDDACNMVFTLAPDGTMLECSFEFPILMPGEASLPDMSADDPTRNYRPFSWPIRVLTRTAGYEGHKGYLEDFWWAAKEDQDQVDIRWGQPGFEGQNMVVCKRGCWWMPCPGEPFKW